MTALGCLHVQMNSDNVKSSRLCAFTVARATNTIGSHGTHKLKKTQTWLSQTTRQWHFDNTTCLTDKNVLPHDTNPVLLQHNPVLLQRNPILPPNPFKLRQMPLPCAHTPPNTPTQHNEGAYSKNVCAMSFFMSRKPSFSPFGLSATFSDPWF